MDASRHRGQGSRSPISPLWKASALPRPGFGESDDVVACSTALHTRGVVWDLLSTIMETVLFAIWDATSREKLRDRVRDPHDLQGRAAKSAVLREEMGVGANGAPREKHVGRNLTSAHARMS